MFEDTSRLPPSGRYRLEILSRGARVYHPHDYQIQALARRGLVAPLQPVAEDGTCRWTITDAGRIALTTDATRQRGSHSEAP